MMRIHKEMRWIVLIVCIVMLFLVAEVSLIYGRKDDPPTTGQIAPWGVDRIDVDKVWNTSTGCGWNCSFNFEG